MSEFCIGHPQVNFHHNDTPQKRIFSCCGDIPEGQMMHVLSGSTCFLQASPHQCFVACSLNRLTAACIPTWQTRKAKWRYSATRCSALSVALTGSPTTTSACCVPTTCEYCGWELPGEATMRLVWDFYRGLFCAQSIALETIGYHPVSGRGTQAKSPGGWLKAASPGGQPWVCSEAGVLPGLVSQALWAAEAGHLLYLWLISIAGTWSVAQQDAGGVP